MEASTLGIHLDLVGGLAGDMFVAAMVDALPELAEPVLAELAAVRPEGAALPAFSETHSGGLRARRFALVRAAGVDGVDYAPVHRHAGAMHAGGGAPGGNVPRGAHGTAYPELRRRLTDAPLAARSRHHALALLALLAEAEGAVHGVPADSVHFHELADWDSIMDVVAAGCIAGRLEGARWSASALPLGGGTVRTAHGVLPVPTPATSTLLRGYPWRDDTAGGERVTPTGAAIVRHLVPMAACGVGPSGGRLEAIGHGAGTRDLQGIPNIARALVFRDDARAGAAASRGGLARRGAGDDTDTDTVVVIEFDVDDMSGEEIAVAAGRVRAADGVVDVSVGTRLGKKGRPVQDFRVLARPHAADAVASACFAETSTLGLRLREERRRLLARSERDVRTGASTIRVKVARRPGGERTAKAADDDAAGAAGLAARRALRGAAEAGALDDETE